MKPTECLARSAITTGIALAGLLILLAILSALPALRDAGSIGATALTPLVLAKAIVATIVFLTLLRFGIGAGAAVRAVYPRFPDLGLMATLGMIAIVAMLAYNAYAAPALLLGVDASVYNWVFLIIVLAPIVGIAVLAGRNMETLTDLVSGGLQRWNRTPAVAPATPQSSSSTPPIASEPGQRADRVRMCAKCESVLNPDAKFCPVCGTAVPTTPRAESIGAFCKQCGGNMDSNAKFCPACGAPARVQA